MRLLAIDPGSNRCGLAWFEDGQLIKTITVTTEATSPLLRRLDISTKLKLVIFSDNPDKITSEEPLLLGPNNNGMQRLLGMIEQTTAGLVNFIHPMTVKKFMGHGGKDKLEVALAAGRLVKTDREQDIIADAIHREAWDETDAAAIGLTYLMKGEQQSA